MSSTILKSEAQEYGDLWRDYWQTAWHYPLSWSPHRLRCFMSAQEGRDTRSTKTGDALVSDLPRGRRPFLGILTNSGTGAASPASGVLEYNEDGHLLTVAPTRSGKGTSQIVPNLLLYGGSCLVIDIKGENYDITAMQRGRMFEGAEVVKFAPFEDGTAHYNPLDFVRVDPDGGFSADTYDDARLLAEMLLGSTAKPDFWEQEARSLLTMLLLYVATRYRPNTPRRRMGTVVELLFPPASATDDESSFNSTVLTCTLHAEERDNRVLLALISQFRDHEPKVKSSILSTCRSAMSIWLSPRLLEATAYSDFQFSDLKQAMCRPVAASPAPLTLYVVVPPEYLKVYRPVLRMLVGLAAVELTRPHGWATAENLAAGWRKDPPCPVLFLLDEFPSLGHMGPIEQGIAYLAGYGVQLWTFIQSLSQLKDIYQNNWSTFISNAGAACYFGIADLELCEFLQKQLGNTQEYQLWHTTTSTTEGSSSGTSSGQSYSYSTSSTHNSGSNDSTSSSTTSTENVRFKEDPVATASELRAMPAELELVLMRNRRPILATLLPYHRTELFSSLYGEWQR